MKNSDRDRASRENTQRLSNHLLHLRSSCSSDSLFRESKFAHLRCAPVVVGFFPSVGTLFAPGFFG
jgi:hypothetical protein